MILSSALLCLAVNVFMEARGEPINTWLAVGYVTTNRAQEEGNSNSICGVVKQKGQFNWKRWKVKSAIKNERELFEEVKKKSSLILNKRVKNPIGKRKYFNHWRLGKLHKTPYRAIRIGQLVFY